MYDLFTENVNSVYQYTSGDKHMGAFNKIKPKAVLGSRRNSTGSNISKPATFAGQMYEQAMNNVVKSKQARRPEYRPSSFPLCSILVYYKLAKGASNGYFEEDRTASGDYFTSIGTAAHENIQYHMGYTGVSFGDWKCKYFDSCEKGAAALNLYDSSGALKRAGKLTRKNTTNNICPSCGRGMEYVEKEIKFRGLKGHIDGILKLPDGGYWVIDYKTCTKHKLNSGKLPLKNHLKQLPTYCYVLKKKYGLDIRGFSLLYFSRDNPFSYVEHSSEWNGKWDRNIAQLVLGERRKFKRALKSFETRNMKYAIEAKPCSSRAYYDDEMGFYTPCPLVDVCFNDRKLQRELGRHTSRFAYTDKARDALLEAINI